MDVILLVTNDALVAQAAELTVFLVALGASQGVMHAVQSEVLVKITSRVPSPLAVTVFASRSEVSMMRILMAIATPSGHRLVANDRAACLREIDILIANRLMTLIARHVPVLVFERIITIPVMIEDRRLPGFFSVAFCAVCIELPLVIIRMTGHARFLI